MARSLVRLYRVRGFGQEFDTYIFARNMAEAEETFREKNSGRNLRLVEAIAESWDVLGIDLAKEEQDRA